MARNRGQEGYYTETHDEEVAKEFAFRDLSSFLHKQVMLQQGNTLASEASVYTEDQQSIVAQAEHATTAHTSSVTREASAYDVYQQPLTRKKFPFKLTATAGLALVSVLAPAVAANASEVTTVPPVDTTGTSTTPASPTSPETQNSRSATETQTISSTAEAQTQTIVSTAEAEKPTTVQIGGTAATPKAAEVSVKLKSAADMPKAQAPITITSTPDTATAAAATTTPVVVATQPHAEVAPVTITSTPDAAVQKATTTVTVEAKTNPVAEPEKPVTIVSTQAPDPSTQTVAVEKAASPGSYIDANGVEQPGKIVKPVQIVSTNTTTLPEINYATATLEQAAIYDINKTIQTSSPKTAVSAISGVVQDAFHDKSILPTSTKNGKGVYEKTNTNLIDNVNGLTKSYIDLIAKNGHKDATYINTTLTVLGVFDALANDQSVLKSPDVQQLLAAVKRPDDEYQGKLFDQYVAKAKEALAANDGQLLKGISDAYKPQLETMYTYALLANVSDQQQGTEIQGIKDAEAAAAAKAAAEEAAKKSQEANKGSYDKTPEAEAMQSLIDNESDPAKKRAYYIMQQIMVQTGLSATAVAGIMGNISVESASTFDPTVDQSNYGGGNAKGIAQWEGPRFKALQRFAAARGTSWNDMDTQIAFLVSELPSQGNIINRLNGIGSVFDAAAIFLRGFERPKDQSDAHAQKRADRGQAFLDAFNAKTNEIATARAAAEAAAKAEAERKAKEAMTFNEAEMWNDSTGIECPEGLTKIGNEVGYTSGKPVNIGLCEVASTNELGKDRPGLVNVRAAALANAMFAQMAIDLRAQGINVDKIALNDSFRTMDGQREAKRKAGDGAADPGWSKHQTGYAFDIVMGTENGGPKGVTYYKGRDKAYPGNPIWEWLKANAAKYHFYQYSEEGWHWSINGQ